MSKYTTLLTAALLAVVPSVGCAEDETAPQAEKGDRATLVRDNNQFAFDLYAQLRESSEGNLFFSPFSISSALAMTYPGTQGVTAEQIAQTMHFTQGADIHPAFASLMHDLTASPEGKDRPYQLAIANALWGQEGYQWLPNYLSLTERYYGAGLREVDFARATEAARQEINAWVEDQTQGKIQNLFPEGVLNNLTRLVLTNAIYFKGNWANQFNARYTHERPFTLANGKTIKAPLMGQKSEFGYAEQEDFLMLQMPYAGDDLAMLVLLPRKADGLAGLEKSLNAENLDVWVKQLRDTKVDVAFPKFKMTSEFQLNDSLQTMGMVDAFDMNRADFSGLNGGTEDLYIQAVVHKAFVEVNEEGTEAAAATGVAIGARSIEIIPEFVADHPFVFVIRSVKDGSVLFVGRVANPTE